MELNQNNKNTNHEIRQQLKQHYAQQYSKTPQIRQDDVIEFSKRFAVKNKTREYLDVPTWATNHWYPNLGLTAALKN